MVELTQDIAEAATGLFAVFTRAKERVIFTYSRSRGMRRAIALLASASV
jgi:hypothetical protein